MTDVIESKLQTMYDENQPDPAFAEQLEQELRRMHIPTTPAKPIQPQHIRIFRRIATIAASFLIVFSLFATVPPLRSFAQDLLSQLFPPTDNDQIIITYRDLGTAQDFLTFDAFDEAVPYTIIAPRELPPGPIETYFYYYLDLNVAMQVYENQSLNMWVSQQPAADAQSNGLLAMGFDLEITDDVEIRLVQIGDIEGELVRGMWVETGRMDADGNMLYRWSENFWFFTLRWRDDEFIYEVAAMPSSQITADVMETVVIDVARSMISD